jgi:D-alanine-D-alanine ligase-like ATP-grasp enzyme
LRIYYSQWPVITRPNKHHAGKNFFVSYSKKELEQNIRFAGGLDNSYTSGFYPKGREVRVHCAFGKVLLIKEKPAPEDKNTIAWNFAVNEEAWSTIDRKDYDPGLCKLALMSMKAIDLDIGAVDIMFEPIKPGFPQYVVCEINTAPSLTPYLAEKYAMLFDKIFTSGIPEYWDYTKFKKGDSFAWKNFQLQQ